MEEMFIEKPVGKPVKNFRARVKMYDNDVVARQLFNKNTGLCEIER